MSIQQKATELFLEQFLLHPTITEVNNQWRWKQEEHPNVSSSAQYDTGRLIHQCFEPLLQEYFTRQGNPIPQDVAKEFIGLAEAYARQGYDHCEYTTNAAAAVQISRLHALILQPTFIADECAVSVMKALKDLENCEPWRFEMWANYDHNNSNRGYYLKPGFGKAQLAGFHRLILCDELWSGQSGEMHRIFLASIAQALRLLAKEQDLLLETVQPRIDLMERNGGDMGRYKHHEPWCNAAFRQDEQAALCKKAREGNDDNLRALIEKIGKAGMWQTPHMC